MSAWKDNREIEMFREYLRIPSVHPDIDYAPCVDFLKRQAADLNLPVKVYHPADPAKPVVVITWLGSQPELPSVILNSHMDVVPVYPEMWTHPPFAAHMDEEGNIYGRGAQDMKSVGMQYLSAIRALKRCGVTLKRTIHVTYVPDEEIGGHSGMKAFVETSDFEGLNVGFSLDEGMATPDDVYPVFYVERSIWQIHFKINGPTGHGLLLLKNTAGQKLQYVLNKMMEFRATESQRLEGDNTLTLGDVTTVNLTKVNGGVQSNVVPPTIVAVFDIRLAPSVDHDTFEKQIRQWCEEAGGDIELEFEQKGGKVAATKIDASNSFWMAFKNCMDDLDLKVRTQVTPGATDSRYLRLRGIPAIGFSPMAHTPLLLHDNDEFVNAKTYLEGIEIYRKLIPSLGNA